MEKLEPVEFRLSEKLLLFIAIIIQTNSMGKREVWQILYGFRALKSCMFGFHSTDVAGIRYVFIFIYSPFFLMCGC
jgi:hypothetical protein